MAGKIGKIILSTVLSLVFFIPAAILLDAIAGMIFGHRSDGQADVNGHAMLAITTLLAIVFGVCFYKYVHLSKKSKEVKESNDAK